MSRLVFCGWQEPGRQGWFLWKNKPGSSRKWASDSSLPLHPGLIVFSMSEDIPRTYGALLLGGFVSMTCAVYFCCPFSLTDVLQFQVNRRRCHSSRHLSQDVSEGCDDNQVAGKSFSYEN